MNWYLEVLKKYAVFSGRARRKEYWYFVLVNIIIAFILGIVDNALGNVSQRTGTGLLGSIYALAIFLPGIGVAVRRLHDTGRTGWWILIAFVPFIGALVLLVFMVLEGQSGGNEYGTDPKAGGTASGQRKND